MLRLRRRDRDEVRRATWRCYKVGNKIFKPPPTVRRAREGCARERRTSARTVEASSRRHAVVRGRAPEENENSARSACASGVYEAIARAERRARATLDLGAVLEVTRAALRE